MGITAIGWRNKGGTGGRACSCGTWKQHWLNYSGKAWPASCSVNGCSNPATLGGHITNPSVDGEKIVPMCASCNSSPSAFNLKVGVSLPSANKSETCDK